MNTFITNTNFRESAANLDRQRLQAQIYEAIHILASLLGVNDKLHNPKRDVSNHPAAKLWVGYEHILLAYIYDHILVWMKRGYKTEINLKNYHMLQEAMKPTPIMYPLPDWVTMELIKTHKSVLIQKFPEHYGKLWPDCPVGLTMRYDWRNEENGY